MPLFLPLLLIDLVFGSAQLQNVQSKLVRATDSGFVRGQILTSTVDNSTRFYAFQGIPFASPPVSSLRFKGPLRPLKWSGVRNITESAVPCAQLTIDLSRIPPIGVTGSEDCLYLDVFDPITARERENEFGLLPVVVWIHGGAFAGGWANTSKPDYFMEKPIIIVMIQYRLHVFGFLSTKDRYAEGNNGLKDQLYALKWVKRNIRNFGGDPNRVTIYGQSAGSISVSYLLISPASRGYFHRAISESGVSLTRATFQGNPTEMAFRLGKGFGITTNSTRDLIEHLQTIDYRNLTLAAFDPSIMGFYIPYYGIPFLPSLERKSFNAFLTKSMYESLKKGYYSKVPYLLGFNTEEGSYAYNFVISGWVNLSIYEEHPELLIPSSMNVVNGSKCASEVVRQIKQFYFRDGNVTNASEWTAYMSQELLVRGISKSVDFTFRNIPTYFYKFSYLGQYTFGYFGGVGHGGELQYLWYPSGGTPISRPDDLVVSKRMVTMWTNFARTGNPTPQKDELLQNITWPRVGSKKQCLLIDSHLTVINDPNKADDEFWDKLFNKCGNPPYITY